MNPSTKLRVYRVTGQWCVHVGYAWYPIYVGPTWQGAMDAAWRRIRRDAA